MKKKRIELPNVIGSRRILKDLMRVADQYYVNAKVMRRMAKHAKTRTDYECWRAKASENQDFAEQLEAFIDIYKIL